MTCEIMDELGHFTTAFFAASPHSRDKIARIASEAEWLTKAHSDYCRLSLNLNWTDNDRFKVDAVGCLDLVEMLFAREHDLFNQLREGLPEQNSNELGASPLAPGITSSDGTPSQEFLARSLLSEQEVKRYLAEITFLSSFLSTYERACERRRWLDNDDGEAFGADSEHVISVIEVRVH